MATRTKTLKRPKVETGAHPIETTRYLLSTPSITIFLTALCQWISNRATGGMVYGPPRFGKTWAIKYLTLMLAEKFGANLPILAMSCLNYTNPREGVFFQDLLRAAGHSLWESGTAAAKRHRLNEFLVEKVERSGQDRLILFVDEAQRLHEQHYNWLIDVHNEMDRNGLVLIVILVGQQQLLHQFSAFQKTSKTQIIGRFMVHQLKFQAITSEKDLRACLANYDINSEYPPDSGFSFTRYYFPAAFDSDLRLESYASIAWQAFREVREELLLPITREIPMQYFCRTVEYVLTSFGTLEDLPTELSLAQWKDAIRKSGYADAERHVVECEKV
jgi:hypothetical protein